MLKHANDRERLAVDVDGFAERNDFAAHFLRRTKDLIPDFRPNHANTPSHLIIDLIKHPAVLDDVLIHLQGNGPYSGAIEGAKPFALTGDGRAKKPHFRRDFGDQRSAVLQGVDIVDRNTDGLIPEVPLFHRHILRLDANLLQTPDSNQSLPCANLHALDQSGHGNQARDTQNDAQHRKDGAEFMRPNLLKADADGIPEVHE
jgi:hypothetical protein